MCICTLNHFSLALLFATLNCSLVSLSFTISCSLLKFMSIESIMPPNHLSFCHFLLLLPSIFPSIRVFSNESALPTKWPKYWSFSFNISPFNEYSGLIFFRIDLFDLLSVQWTLWSLLQHQSSKASILWCSAFFIGQLSHPYMTTGKTIALTRRTFVGMTSHTGCLSVLQYQAPCCSCLRTFALPVASIQRIFPLKAPPGYFLCIF